MAKIQVMSQALANQIAAGEVIERPASVVKELVENAIDAQATQIDIRIKEAGLEEIQVVDDGVGMDKEDINDAFLRHATSKLFENEDLFRIRTLGFRGEALPSIASVSHLEIESSTGDEPGNYLHLIGGDIIEERPASQRKGTTITVRQLFYNTPARLKHVKSLRTELSHITDLVNRFAFAHPDISFRLENEGQMLIRTVGNGDLQQAIAGVYGVETARKMIPIQNEDRNYKVTGYISSPDLTRSTNKYITFVVNQRVIRNYRLLRALETGYGSKLMINRHPIAVVHIETDPLLVDVNVHPTKQEVRLSGEEDIEALLKTAVNESLQAIQRIPDALDNIDINQRTQVQKGVQSRLDLSAYEVQPTQSFQEEPPAWKNWSPYFQPSEASPTYEPNRFESLDESAPAYDLPPRHDEDPLETVGKGSFNQASLSRESFPELEYVGQAHGTYLIFQNESGIYFMDQHAAQERIKYEYYREEIGKGYDADQQLLIPIVLEYSKADALIIEENKDHLEAVGLNLEPFGGTTYILRSHPSWFIKGQEESTAREMIDFLLERKSLNLSEFREATAIMMSCKRSIKANHHLNSFEAIQLVKDLRETENPYNCPHGRPVLVKLTNQDIEKMFKRIQD